MSTIRATRVRDPFLKGRLGPHKPKSQTSLLQRCVIHIFLLICRSSLYNRYFRRIPLSVSRYRGAKNGFAGLKRFLDFRETGIWLVTRSGPFVRRSIVLFPIFFLQQTNEQQAGYISFKNSTESKPC